MQVRTQLSLTSVSLVLIPGLLLGGVCAFLMLRQADTSTRVVREGLEKESERSLSTGVQREREFVQNLINQASSQTLNLAASSQAPVALGAADPTTSPAMQEALATIGRGSLDTVAQFKAQADLLQLLLERNLQMMTQTVESHGPAQLGEPVERQITNQVTKATAPVQVPSLSFGDHPLPWIDATGTPCPIIDDLAHQTGGLFTIFVRAGDGSMIRTATNVPRGTQRAIGTCIPAVEGDGKPGAVLKAVMAGETYRGLAKVVDQWCLTAYQPLRAADGSIIGMLFTGLRINDTPTLANGVLNRRFGKTGYACVVDANGRMVIHPRQDLIGKHLVDDLKLTALAPALGPAEPGTASRIDYAFEGHAKFAIWTRMAGWNWTFLATGTVEEIAGDFVGSALTALRIEFESVYRGSNVEVNGQKRPLFNQIRLLDAAGKELINLQGGKHTEALKDKSDMAWFKAALADQSGGIYIHALELAANTGKPELRLIAPILVNGKRMGFTVLSLDWTIVNDLLVAHTYGKTGYPWMIDDSGVIVVHPKFTVKEARKATDPAFGPLAALAQTRMLPGETGVSRYLWDGHEKYTAFSPMTIGKTRYSIAVSVPAGEIMELADSLGKESRTAAIAGMPILTCIVIAISVAGAGVGLWLARRLVRPLAVTEAVLGKVAQGDLTARLGLTTNDEYGRMSQALDQALGAMAASTRTVSQHSKALGVQAGNLTRIGKDLSENAAGTDTQATAASASAQEVARSASSLAAAVQELEASIQEIARGGQTAVQTAREAVTAADGASAGMEQLRTTSAEISSIIQTITGIAEQVNLLALNATIEAARAGDAGRGFAVVANEVKELARRVQAASADIGSRITSIQGQVGASAGAMTQIAGFIKRLDELQQSSASAVEEQAATAKEMSRSVQSTAEAAQSIAGGIEAVVMSSRATTAAAGEANQAAGELQGIARELDTAAGRFRT